MKAREARIKSWTERKDITLDEMWGECAKRGYTDYLAVTRKEIIEYVIDNIRHNMKVAPLIASVEERPYAEYYGYDVTSYSNAPATPIYTKQDLAAVLTGGNEND